MAKGKGDRPAGFEEFMAEHRRYHGRIPFRGQDEPTYKFRINTPVKDQPVWVTILTNTLLFSFLFGSLLIIVYDQEPSVFPGVLGVVIQSIIVILIAVVYGVSKNRSSHTSEEDDTDPNSENPHRRDNQAD
jgi:hypothetical protein